VQSLYQPGLSLTYHHHLHMSAPQSPGEQMAAFADRVMAALQKAALAHYPWATAQRW
jgi:hypothetical protein